VTVVDERLPETVQADVFRDVIGRFATGVTVITARCDGLDYGMTASAVTSLSLDPPTLLVCINRANATYRAIDRSGAFGVSILHEGQAEVAAHFASRHPDKFAAAETAEGQLGLPLVAGALATLECAVSEHFVGGTHEVFLGRIVVAHAAEGRPLTYFRGAFGHFGSAADEATYQDLRGRVLGLGLLDDAPLRIDSLARELQVPPAQVLHALTRLVTEGLVSRDPERGYVVVSLDAASLGHAFDARRALELAVVDSCTGRVPEARLAELRRRMEATLPLIKDGELVGLATYIAADDAFHGYLVSLADNPLLDSLYQRVGVEGIMLRAKRSDPAASEELVGDHRELVEALEAGDADRARRVIRRHAERGKELGRQAIEAERAAR
jgi:4-nitrophenol 2-monooxygenase / 4-nitrocatechol 4-monooxygenase, reductase component